MMPPTALTLDQLDRQLRALSPDAGGRRDWGVTGQCCRFSFMMGHRRCHAELFPTAEGAARLRFTVSIGHVPFSAEGAVAREAAKSLLAELSLVRPSIRLQPNAKGDLDLVDERMIDPPITAEAMLLAVVNFVHERRPWIQLLTSYLADRTPRAPNKPRF